MNPAVAATTHTSNAPGMVRVLGAVSLLCGLAIVATHVNTLRRIRHNQETIMKESVTELLPGMTKQIVYGIEDDNTLKILPGVEGQGRRMLAGYDSSGRLLGLVIEASGRGYADVISTMYSFDPEKKVVTGFKVVDMRETPGLGNRIGTDEEFAKNFKSLDATHPIATVKHGTKKNAWEIDAISGATISSRAVGKMLQKTTEEMAPVIDKNLSRIQRGE
jgi:Na+-translocating ferredoxin:NAD+ oxidoreductase subunit G